MAIIKQVCPLAIATILALNVVLCQLNEDVSGYYDELDKKQVAQLRRDELKTGFEAIEGVLGQQRTGFNPRKSFMAAELMQDQLDPASESSHDVQLALDLFLQLPKAAKMCNYAGYKIFARNFAAIPTSSGLSSSSIILYHFMHEHDNWCSSQYVQEFVELSTTLSEEIGILSRTLEDIDGSYFLLPGDRPASPLNQVLIRNNLNSLLISDEGLRRILENIREIAKEEDLSNLVPDDRNEVPELFKLELDNYLYEPCKAYVDSTRDIFAPAKIDFLISGKPNNSPLVRDEQFLDGWTRYRICVYMIKNRGYGSLSKFVDVFY